MAYKSLQAFASVSILIIAVSCASESPKHSRTTISCDKAMEIHKLTTIEPSLFREKIDYVRSTLSDRSGMSVVLFDAKDILFQYHTGYAYIENQLPVDEETSFYIASTTKSIMATTVLKLVEAGTLDLDIPIENYLPELYFDSWLLSEKKLTLRHLLTHNTGISSKALEIRTSMTGQYDDGILKKLYSEANGSFFKPSYSNLNYILIGLMIEKVTGKTWQYQMKKLVFDPMGMTRSFTEWPDFGTNNVALPHTLDSMWNLSTVSQTQSSLKTNTLLPSGGVISSARDLSRYVQTFLNCGDVGGKSYLPSSTIKEATSLQAEVESGGEHDYLGYGLGWEIANHDSLNLVLHNGSNKVGARAYMAFSPELKMGLVILSNENIVTPYVHTGIARFTWDILRDPTIADTNLEENLKRWKTKLQDRFSNRMEGRYHLGLFHRNQYFPDSPLSNFVGKYFSEEFGTVIISLNEHNQLSVEYGNLRSSQAIRITKENFVCDFGIESYGIDFEISGNKVKGVEFRGIEIGFDKVE